MADYNLEDVAKLKHVNALAQLTKNKLSKTVQSGKKSDDGLKYNFYGTADASGTPLFSLDFPEEMYLAQTGTEIVENFTFSAATYPGATNPNLDGKTVLVLAVKGNAATPTVEYSFVDMAKVIKALSAGDKSIDINGYTVKVNISQAEGNLLELKEDGLFVGSDDTKVDKVTSAVTGNFAVFGASGAVVDSGFTVASDSSVAAMLNETFGAGSINADLTIPE